LKSFPEVPQPGNPTIPFTHLQDASGTVPIAQEVVRSRIMPAAFFHLIKCKITTNLRCSFLSTSLRFTRTRRSGNRQDATVQRLLSSCACAPSSTSTSST